jgi:DNA mismatch repair protein MutL
MSKIKKLSDQVINLIRAGEVITRPAQVVKECIENSLDADCDRIEVHISDAGKDYIIVKDDGAGMSLDDLNLSVQNHTTSKLYDEYIQDVSSYGFRGEALSSIASVSNFSISSISSRDENGWILKIENGKIIDHMPSSIKSGTTIECRNLFQKHPVRLKFLKSNQYENQVIKDVVNRYALSKPAIGFKLTIDNNLIFDYPPEKIDTRLIRIFPREFMGNSYSIGVLNDYCSINGNLGLPSWTDNSKYDLFVYVNARPVKNKDIIDTIKSYYKELGSKEMPCGILNFYTEPEQVDINIHPTKDEVRFVDQEGVLKTLKDAIKEALGTIGPIASSFLSSQALSLAKLKSSEDMEEWTMKPLGKPIDIVLNTFLVAENLNCMYLIDFHAAHERIINEKLKVAIKNKNITQISLMQPTLIDVGNKNIVFFEENQKKLEDLGFLYNIFNENSLLFNEIPEYFIGSNLKDLVNEFVKAYINNKYSLPIEEFINYISGELSCHAAKKSGDKLTHEEMFSLLREMEITPNAFICNHGRPTVLEFEKNSLLKLFGRK